MSIQLEQKAQDPKSGMTLAELITFVRHCEVNKINLDARVKVTAGMNLQLRKIRAEEQP